MKRNLLLIIGLTITVSLCSCSDASYLKEASLLTRQEDYKNALAILETKVVNKRNPKYLLMHGLCCSKMKIPRYRDAVTDFKALEKTKYGEDKKVLFKISDWSFHIHEYEDAIFSASKAMPDFDAEMQSILRFFIASSYYNLGRYEESLHEYSELAKDDNATPYMLIDYNKLLSITNGDDSLVLFWDSLNLDGQKQEDKENLLFYYAKALLEIGKIEESAKCFDLLKTSSLNQKLIQVYDSFREFLLTKSSPKEQGCFYVEDIEKVLDGTVVVFLSPPDLELLKLSVIYFYFCKDYERVKMYCSLLIKWEKDLKTMYTISNIDDVRIYLKNDRLFNIAESLFESEAFTRSVSL